MEVQRAFAISPIHLQSVFIFLCTLGQLYSAIAIPSASSSYANYATNLSLSASASASTCILLLRYYATFASTSTSAPASASYSNHNNYNVFLNYNRPDVGKTFASHLARSLISHGLRIGNIETAAVHIAIFSKNYAKSSYCLDHLRIMLKSGAPIIPVFYDVNPSDLQFHVMYAPVLRMFRWTPVKNGGLYGEDLRMLEEEKTFDPQTCQQRPRHDSNTIAEWSMALFDASRICGFELAAYNGDEGQLVHNVVKRVLSIKRGWSMEEPRTPIGYDVFINHRGTDVKNTLASHLYYRLSDYGLRVFFDKEEAQKGYTVNSEVENAIRLASVHIAIFSKRYAESEWCMDELVLMVESESVIIPVFYDVKPKDIWWNHVDGMNGVYAEALLILKEEKTFDPETHREKPRYDSHTIEIWQGVLMEVTGRDGFELETYDGDEGQLVDNVVREVVKKKNEG